MRHSVLTREASSFPFVTRIESLMFELDSTSLRTEVFHFFQIFLAKEDGTGGPPPLCYQFQEGRWPIRVSERFYVAVRGNSRTQ